MDFREWFKERANVTNELYIRLDNYEDIEVLHQYRVNLRKLYACSEVYAKQVDKKKSKELSKLIKRIIKPTSALRDLDVFLGEIETFTCSAQIKKKLHNILNIKRATLFEKFSSAVKSDEYKNNLKDFYTMSKSDKFFLYKKIGRVNNYKTIKNIEKIIYGDFNKIDESTSFTELHELRMKFKKFRYALNIYEQCFDEGKKISTDLSKLKILQDLFGAIQDNLVRLEFVKSLKGELTKKQLIELKDYFKKNLNSAREKLYIFKDSKEWLL
ncbi:CHAD domain-containing protein [Candidatus Sulfurimonas marisnigri]|uniref:CHAD domain-containing protein n=1 Tax=Candidatus Sulfurimonas marisnigri TaxID=2740405 RepID=A0A7S7LY76_9BACT|nr:CHAD domain-containing protein [Candidatus Sulfurimonas marisnigri]QOY53557.1 CHAD domain-containing protein [Candidatus Sulfurimonas marisnigri]